MLDLSENRFSGFIPPDFGELKKLEILRISSNRLTGPIPIELSQSPRLIELDLSKNDLSGTIPSEIISSLTLKRILLQENKLNGVIPDAFYSSQHLTELQLGSNLIEGPIPCSLGVLQHLSSILNLSMNRLSGEIPKCLSNLDKLEILDISSNQFSGEIPSELNSMVSLSLVNISFNQLSGRVPVLWRKALDSHPGSFLGNSRLCLHGRGVNNACREARKPLTGKFHTNVIIVLFLSMFVLVAAVSLVVIRVRQRFPPQQYPLGECRSRSEDLPEDLKFDDIMRATEGWSERYVIGRGKHGTVYRAESMRSRKNWAVKKVDLSETKFNTEIRTLSSIRHRNVVKMGGYSIRNGYGIILTEFMPGGTLHDVLHRIKPRVDLNWETRHRIALGIAQGLSYLHHDCVPQVIHRDIKSDNIFLDAELEPKIGDFGMAKMVSTVNDDNSSESVIVGTLGYMAPGKKIAPAHS